MDDGRSGDTVIGIHTSISFKLLDNWSIKIIYVVKKKKIRYITLETRHMFIKLRTYVSIG